MKESPRRSLAKALSWRLMAVAITMSLVWVVTGKVALAAGVGLGEFVFKLVAYYAHERLWARIPDDAAAPVTARAEGGGS